MATQAVYNGDGSNRAFPITFSYQTIADIQVFVDDQMVSFALSGLSQVLLTVAPAAGSRIRVARVTPFSIPSVDFQDGAVLTADDLDTAQLQLFYRLQEVSDQLANVAGRAILFPDGETGVTLPNRDRAGGKYLGFDAGGNLVPISGPADGPGLRGDLADPAVGPALVGFKSVGAPVTRTVGSRLTDAGLTSGDFLISTTADATAKLAALFAAAALTPTKSCTVLRRDYIVSDTIVVPEGVTVNVEPGTRFLWQGVSPPAAGPWRFMFDTRSFSKMLSTGGPKGLWYGVSADEKPYLSVVGGFAIDTVEVTGAFGINMTRGYYDAVLGYAGYDGIITPAMKAAGDTRALNISRNIHLAGGGCEFPNHFPTGGLGDPERAGDYFQFPSKVLVEDSTYTGCYAGVQYWGGDSGLASFQDMGRLGPNAERKATDVTVRNCVSRRTGAGFWGSMGQRIHVENCSSYTVGDVAHDHEGSIDVLVKDSYAEDVRNGALATFSYSRNVVFQNCTVRQSKKEYPIFRVYNASQTQLNEDITILGGNFVCTDPTGPSTLDTNFGPARSVSLIGAKLENVVINFNTLNNNRVVVSGNDIRLPVRLPSGTVVLGVGGLTNAGYGPAIGVIKANTVTSNVLQPANVAAVETTGVDFNSNARFRVSLNTLAITLDGGGGAGIRLSHGSGNGGQTTFAVVDNNQLDGPIVANNSGPGVGTNKSLNNFNTLGNPVNL